MGNTIHIVHIAKVPRLGDGLENGLVQGGTAGQALTLSSDAEHTSWEIRLSNKSVKSCASKNSG